MMDDLADLLYRLRTAETGSRCLDTLIDAVLLPDAPAASGGGVGVEATARWSQDLPGLLRLVPPNYNFCLGERDGVPWAWIQPNDDWAPGPSEKRHDHPCGSGLTVARTLPLALATALVALWAKLRRHTACAHAKDDPPQSGIVALAMRGCGRTCRRDTAAPPGPD